MLLAAGYRNPHFVLAVLGLCSSQLLVASQDAAQPLLPSSAALRSPEWLGEVLSGDAVDSAPGGRQAGGLSALEAMEAKLLKMRGESVSGAGSSAVDDASGLMQQPIAAISAAPAQPLEQSEGLQSGAPVVGQAPAFEEGDAVRRPASEEVDAVRRPGSSTQLSAIRSSEALLTAENAELRTQLRRWHSSAAAAKAAAAKAAGMQRPAGNAGRGGRSLESVGLLDLKAGSRESTLEANSLRLFALFIVANAVLFLLWRSNQESGSHGLSKSGRPAGWVQQVLAPVLRAIGLGPCEIEISEMQIGNLGPGGEVFISLHVDGNNDQCTGISERMAAGLVRFKHSFSLQVSGSGSNSQMCTLAVRHANSLSQDTVATLALSTKEIMRRVRSKHGQQYFNFNLTMHEQLLSGNQVTPQLALRLREIRGSKFGNASEYES
eukprot:TRINITY_DN18244_c0_g1_i2.p1 TRINITY_DN18244_c0_g1~~TRINITY_DN18244_c0_g1_i2.p1  ORF type:complete len:435 (+),score=94.79 TRINITY_DN18244_c0_g1_i2:88-1392(+)